MKKISLSILIITLFLMACSKNDVKISTSLSDSNNLIRETNKEEENIRNIDDQGRDFSLRETKEIDFESLKKFKLPIIVDYGADSCIPCRRMAPVLEKANKDYVGKAFIKFINVWDYPDAARNVPVNLIPTQVLFTNEVKPFIPSGDLSKNIEFTMYNDNDGNHIFTVHEGALTYEEMELILKEMGV